MGQLGNAIQTIMTSQLTPIAVTIVGLVIMIVGFSFMLGRKGREWGKEQILWTIGGAALIYGATTYAQQIMSTFTF